MQDLLSPLKQLIANKLEYDDFFSFYMTCHGIKFQLHQQECFYRARVRQISYFEPTPLLPALSTYKRVFAMLNTLLSLKGNYNRAVAGSMHLVNLVIETPHLLQSYFAEGSGADDIIRFMTRWKPLQTQIFNNQYLRDLYKDTQREWMWAFFALISRYPEFFDNLLEHPDMIETLIAAYGFNKCTAHHIHPMICDFVEKRYQVHHSLTQPVRFSTPHGERQETFHLLFMHLSENYRVHIENNPYNAHRYDSCVMK